MLDLAIAQKQWKEAMEELATETTKLIRLCRADAVDIDYVQEQACFVASAFTAEAEAREALNRSARKDQIAVEKAAAAQRAMDRKERRSAQLPLEET